MKTINFKKALLGVLLALTMFTGVGCVVADRPYYYGAYRPFDVVRSYERYGHYAYRDYNRWQRQRDHWDRD